MTDQPDFFPETPRPGPAIDPDMARAELLQLLATARAAQREAPWDRRTHRFHAVVFPQKARWLPEEEATQLCLQFAEELNRIEALLAA
ncbi:MAG TPA: hypothetical protein VFZ91_04065 [Allosphingosinicella sp.]